jgi:hypothetical protein
MLWLQRLLWALPAIGALIWTGPALRVRRSGIFPTQLNDSELIRGSLEAALQNLPASTDLIDLLFQAVDKLCLPGLAVATRSSCYYGYR